MCRLDEVWFLRYASGQTGTVTYNSLQYSASLLNCINNVYRALKKTFFCVPTDELLQAKDDLLSEGGQSLNSIFAVCFGDWFIGIPFVGDDVVAKCISKLH